MNSVKKSTVYARSPDESVIKTLLAGISSLFVFYGKSWFGSDRHRTLIFFILILISIRFMWKPEFYWVVGISLFIFFAVPLWWIIDKIAKEERDGENDPE